MAGFVLTLAIATSITTLNRGLSSLDTARNSTLASQIMQSEIERIRLMPWDLPGGAVDSIQELPASDTVPLASMFSANPALAAKFTVTRTVTADATRPADIKHISLTATWTSYDGRSHTRSYSTMYSRKGLYDYYYVIAAP